MYAICQLPSSHSSTSLKPFRLATTSSLSEVSTTFGPVLWIWTGYAALKGGGVRSLAVVVSLKLFRYK